MTQERKATIDRFEDTDPEKLGFAEYRGTYRDAVTQMLSGSCPVTIFGRDICFLFKTGRLQ